ncbi:type IV secretion system DNA-binding domain-containing protein [Candidatus Gracilibacteria bacterium]|nr:type IV secretion system DNA-binding domain-containing protein [Candidatus Gracilibacteria bacterium]
MFHLPNIRFNKYPRISWQNFKIAPAPPNIPKEGILLGHNIYRGEKEEIRLKREDRMRHFYVIGQTGTGKSSILQVMIRQDLENGDGLCVIDPHGSLIEDILPFIPRHRADDVIYFNPSDMERPMGLNLLEGDTWEEKELVAMDAMNIMIKLFNEEVFGPRIQDYFRNGCLTLMSDPAGGAITDIVRLFTDDDFAKLKRQHITNPVVASFWDHQMAKTGAREKQEMIPYFSAKFGQFVTNTMMRNIIGQAKSAFNFYDVMQNKKILLMNLSKGTVGEINSKLLGLIIVQKIQMATLRREKIKKSERSDFFLYIDEFQNYVTDSIESILSEARKYRLSLNIAHQYLAQISDQGGGKGGKGVDLKSAVFGNVGTMMCFKVGAQDAEEMAKEMAPVFSDQDLINIDKFKAVMKLSIDTQPSRPFSIIPVNPYTVEGDMEAAEAFKQLSRLKYGRDREFVDREILRRLGASGT